ncbi:MAG: homocysteine S-methyltransferase family protein [Thermoplasmatota archaeon]
MGDHGRAPSVRVLDGPMGTELEALGHDTTGPAWTASANAEAPHLVTQVHRAHVEAGADVLTANSFRTHPSVVEQALGQPRGAGLAEEAVRVALAAAEGRPVMGSLAPMGDCYDTDQEAPAAWLTEQHAHHARTLVAAGCNGLLVETMTTVREAVAAAEAARAVAPDLPLWVSCVPCLEGRLLSGESWDKLARTLAPADPDILLVNCGGLPTTAAAAPRLRQAWPGRWGVYPNRSPEPPQAWATQSTLEELEAAARGWIAEGASVVGTCCGWRPDATALLRRLVDEG